ncbi:MAG: hypothetical protein MJ156_01740 [Alphaproteobacteria bacterium]|nr:hypothetical protein [Alphaproteobacteria bacterium]
MLVRLFKLILTIIVICIIVYLFAKFFPETYNSVKHFFNMLIDETIEFFNKAISYVSALFH